MCARESVCARPAWRVDLGKIPLYCMCVCQTQVRKNKEKAQVHAPSRVINVSRCMSPLSNNIIYNDIIL